MKRTRGERAAERRLALRIAARSSVRSVGRSALIALMVALPVAGIAGVAVVHDSTQPMAAERVTTELGNTQAQLLVVSPPSETLRQVPTSHSFDDDEPRTGQFVEPADVLPPDTTILALSTATVTAATPGGSAAFDVLEGPAWHESFAGKYDIVEGRAPDADDEVMVTASLLPRLGARLGQTVQLQHPAPSSVTIVGILDDQTRPDSDQWFFAREGALSGEPSDPSRSEFYLPNRSLDWPAVEALNAQGITAVSRQVLLNPPPAGAGAVDESGSSVTALVATVVIVAAFAAFEVILLAGAAFTVTARQQQRMLATIASVGAPRRLLFRILAASGMVLGLIGGLIGVVAGVSGAAAFMALTADGSSTRYFGFHIPWFALLGSIVFAVVIGWIASLLPARAASRFDIVAALRGARKPPTESARTPVIGLVMLVVGVALALVGGILIALLLQAGRGMPYGHPLMWIPVVMLIVGPILAQLGLVLCGPLLLRQIARVLQRGSIGARLASRDAARNPSRAVPALASVMTTVFVAVLAMCLVASGEENSRTEHQYQRAVGQIAVPLQYYEHDAETGASTTFPYDNPARIENALRGAVEVKELRTLATVPDPYWVDETTPEQIEAVEGTAVPIPTIPRANLCPSNPQSPDHTAEIASESPASLVAMDSDWRCASFYPYMSSATGGHIFVGDARDLALVLDREPSTDAKRALDDGGAVSLYPHYVKDGEFTIEWWPAARAAEASSGWQDGEALRSETIPAVTELPAHPFNFGLFISSATADRLGLDYVDSMVLASTRSPLDTEQNDALNRAFNGFPDGIYADVEAGPPQYATLWSWALLALSALIAVAAAAVAIGLARFDGRQDDATLSSLGAGASIRRSFAFWQALVIAGFGTVLGVGMGLVPALALSALPNFPFTPPWLQVGLTLVALPLLISVGSWVLTRRSRVSARRLTIG